MIWNLLSMFNANPRSPPADSMCVTCKRLPCALDLPRSERGRNSLGCDAACTRTDKRSSGAAGTELKACEHAREAGVMTRIARCWPANARRDGDCGNETWSDGLGRMHRLAGQTGAA